MKTKILLSFTLLFISSQISAQEKPIYFTYPTNGTVISIPENQSSVNITIHYSYSGILGTNEMHKLIATQTYQSSVYPYNLETSFTLPAGEYTWKLERYVFSYGLGYELLSPADQITFYVRPTLTARNNFESGIINVNGLTVNNGYQITPSPGFSTSFEAIDQDFGNYYRLFYSWSGASSAPTRSTSVEAPTTSSQTATANFVRQFNVTFENPKSSTNINGQIYYSSSNTVYLRENYQVSASGYSTSANGIDFTFSHWVKNNQVFSSNFYPSDHETYTAVYTGKPNDNYRNLSFNTSQEGQPVQLTWSMHPLDNASISHYAVYRKVTSSGTPTLLTTVSATGSSSYSYTDYEFAISNSQNKILLFYDVRAYYTPDAAYSGAAFEGVYGFYYSNKLPEEIAQNQTIQTIPETFEVNNYPNPFNPSTTINYQLPENGFVTLKVFDILGKEIETLVNENKSAGYYKVNFDGSNLTSGVYIYTIRVNEIMQSKKMLLAK